MAGMRPTQRTMRALRERGTICEVVERFNPYAGKYGQRHDLFNIIDIIALDPERGVVGIQACSQSSASHLRKLKEERAQESMDWLSTPGTKLELWCWRKLKLKKGGKAMRWTPKVTELLFIDFIRFDELSNTF